VLKFSKETHDVFDDVLQCELHSEFLMPEFGMIVLSSFRTVASLGERGRTTPGDTIQGVTLE